MKTLEKEIRQKIFRNEFHKLGVNIIYTNNWLHSKHHKILKPYKLSKQQYNILRILRGQHPEACSINLLIIRMLDKSSNASRLCDKLYHKKLITRTTNESDRRQVDILITQKGLDILAELDVIFEKFNNSINSITEEEARQLNYLLDKFRNMD